MHIHNVGTRFDVFVNDYFMMLLAVHKTVIFVFLSSACMPSVVAIFVGHVWVGIASVWFENRIVYYSN